MLSQRVSKYFQNIGKDPRDAPLMLVRYAVVIAIFTIAYFVMFWKPASYGLALVPWIAAAISGWSAAMMGFYICHDGCHASFSKSPTMWTALRRSYESFTGLSTLLWIYQHGLGHHPYTNVIGADPDVISDDPGSIRVHEEQPWWGHYNWQRYYWLPLYSQLILSRKLTEWKNVFYDRQYKTIKINPPQMSEYVWCATVMVSLLLSSIELFYSSCSTIDYIQYSPLHHSLHLFQHWDLSTTRSPYYY
jgi:fatty acid desaturase